MPTTDPMFGKDQTERDALEEFILQLGKVIYCVLVTFILSYIFVNFKKIVHN